MNLIGRNDACHCGSGKKYKKCCLQKDEQQRRDNVIPFPGAKKAPKSEYTREKLLQSIHTGMEWKSDIYKEVAETFIEEVFQSYPLHNEISRKLASDILTDWNQYTANVEPNFRKPGGYAAALEYLFANSIEAEVTQQELAKKHDVSTGTLGRSLNQFYDYVEENGALETVPQAGGATSSVAVSMRESEEQMRLIHELLAQQNFETAEQAQTFVNNLLRQGPPKLKANTGSPAQQARELLMEADRETSPARRKKLAKQAIDLDSGNADAYLLLSQEADTLEESLRLAQTGMNAAAEGLGEVYFKENTGHFWGLIETRPFMRIKFAYARLLQAADNEAAAAGQYEELLQLCPNDNLGARYELLAIYLNQGELEPAQRLLEEHQEEASTVMVYDRLVLEYLLNGESGELVILADAARKANRFVPVYVTGQKKLSRIRNDYVSPGDEGEAEEYAYSHRQLWAKPELDGLKTLLTKR